MIIIWYKGRYTKPLRLRNASTPEVLPRGLSPFALGYNRLLLTSTYYREYIKPQPFLRRYPCRSRRHLDQSHDDGGAGRVPRHEPRPESRHRDRRAHRADDRGSDHDRSARDGLF